jgi:hypothetical protein
MEGYICPPFLFFVFGGGEVDNSIRTFFKRQSASLGRQILFSWSGPELNFVLKVSNLQPPSRASDPGFRKGSSQVHQVTFSIPEAVFEFRM